MLHHHEVWAVLPPVGGGRSRPRTTRPEPKFSGRWTCKGLRKARGVEAVRGWVTEAFKAGDAWNSGLPKEGLQTHGGGCQPAKTWECNPLSVG